MKVKQPAPRYPFDVTKPSYDAIVDSLDRELPRAFRNPAGLDLEINGWSGAILQRRGQQLELETGQLRLPFQEIVSGCKGAARRATGG